MKPIFPFKLQAIKVQLYPSNIQKEYIARLLGSSRFVFNKTLEFKKIGYNTTGKFPSWGECAKHFTELRNSEEFSWLKEVHTHPIKQSLNDLEIAFSNFFDKNNKAEFPKFKSKHDKESCRFPSTAISGISGNRLSLTKKLGDIHFKCSRHDEIALNRYQSKIHSATLERTKSGRYFISILLDKPLRNSLPKTDKIIGVDIGIKEFVVTSENERFENIKTIRCNEKKLKKLQRQVSNKQKGSKNKEKARLKLAKFNEKLKNRKENYLHSISNKLLNDNQVIVFETLNITGMMKNHSIAKSIQELSASRFKEICSYKALWYKRDIISINQFFPSSKLCECCGFKNDELTLKDRTWICPSCGVEHDRDLNAARNIRDEGLRLLGLRSSNSVKTKTKRSLKKSKPKQPSVNPKLPACSGDIKLEEKTIETSMNQEKNVITDVVLVVG